MKAIILIFLMCCGASAFSQTRRMDVNVNPRLLPDRIDISLNSQTESLNNCSVRVLDSARHIIKTVQFPKAVGKQMMKQFTEASIDLTDLVPGFYTYIIYLGKEEMYSRHFFKDAILAEPMNEPVPVHH
jgi:hypothetical protein